MTGLVVDYPESGFKNDKQVAKFLLDLGVALLRLGSGDRRIDMVEVGFVLGVVGYAIKAGSTAALCQVVEEWANERIEGAGHDQVAAQAD